MRCRPTGEAHLRGCARLPARHTRARCAPVRASAIRRCGRHLAPSCGQRDRSGGCRRRSHRCVAAVSGAMVDRRRRRRVGDRCCRRLAPRDAQLRRRRRLGTRAVRQGGVAVRSGARPRLEHRRNGTHLQLDVDGLAPAGPNEYYTIWMTSDDGQHVPAGTFRESGQIEAWSGVKRSDFPRIWITLEPDDGDERLTGRRSPTRPAGDPKRHGPRPPDCVQVPRTFRCRLRSSSRHCPRRRGTPMKRRSLSCLRPSLLSPPPVETTTTRSSDTVAGTTPPSGPTPPPRGATATSPRRPSPGGDRTGRHRTGGPRSPARAKSWRWPPPTWATSSSTTKG